MIELRPRYNYQENVIPNDWFNPMAIERMFEVKDRQMAADLWGNECINELAIASNRTAHLVKQKMCFGRIF
jgi:hypothetical protein